MGRFSDMLTRMNPLNGRYIAEDGSTVNLATFIRRLPISIGRGKYPGATPISAFGERTSTGAESNYPVWPNGAVKVGGPGGVQLAISSTSANDTADGTHAQQIEIHALLDDLTEYRETLTLDGASDVLTQAENIRFVQCMHVKRVGGETTNFNDGTIYAKDGAEVFSQIEPKANRCSSSFRMVPKGKRLHIESGVTSSISGTSATRTQVRMVATEIDGEQYLNPIIFFAQSGIGQQDSGLPFMFPDSANGYKAGSIVGCQHTSDKAATISCSWFGRLEPDEDYG